MHTFTAKAQITKNLRPEKFKLQGLEPLTIFQRLNNLKLSIKAWQKKKNRLQLGGLVITTLKKLYSGYWSQRSSIGRAQLE